MKTFSILFMIQFIASWALLWELKDSMLNIPFSLMLFLENIGMSGAKQRFGDLSHLGGDVGRSIL